MKNNNNSSNNKKQTKKNKITNAILHIHIQISLSSKFQIQPSSLTWQLFFLPKKSILGLKKIKRKSPPHSAYLN